MVAGSPPGEQSTPAVGRDAAGSVDRLPQTCTDVLDLDDSQPSAREPGMILTVKLLLSGAMLAYAIGYAARHRDNRLHRMVMPGALLLTVAIPAVVAFGRVRFGAPYRPAYWLVQSLGTDGRVNGVLAAHAVLFCLALMVLLAQGVTGFMRLPLHRRLPPYAAALWLAAYLGGMFLLA